MRKRAVVCITIIGLIQLSYSQKLPDMAIGMPQQFDRPHPDIEKNIPSAKHERAWKVYSDRNNNMTYTGPGGNEVRDTIQYMQRFYVAEMQGDYLHIYKDPIRPNFPGISSSAESYGWIHKDHLLLWEHSLVNQQNHIDKKAMILSTFERITSEKIEDQLVEYRFDPGLTETTGGKARIFEILFVYKILDDAVLLGEDVGIYGTEEDVVGLMKGWVPKGSVTFWDHRFTLEPNWEAAAYREREEKDVVPTVFADARAARDYQRGEESNDDYVIWTNEPGPKRNIGEWRRFPILPSHSYAIYKAGVMGKITGPTSMTVERYSEIREASSNLEQQKRRINVVFVVDGTQSMGKYYKSISNGIGNSMNMLKSDDSQNRFRFGAVIYRDKAEKEHLVDIISLQDDHHEVINFLSRARTDYSNDKDVPEALYYGLKKALTSVGLSKQETNFIIIIGDAGNHNRFDETKIEESEIINLLSDYECSIISFQAYNGLHDTFDDFIAQSNRLIIGTANKIALKEKEKKDTWRPDEYEQPYFITEGPTRFSLNNQEIIGSYLFPDKGRALPYSELQKEITEKITRFDARTSTIIQEGKEVIAGQELTTSNDQGEVFEYSEAVIGFLSKIQGLSNDEIEMLKVQNYQFSMDGYTSREVYGLNFPIFREVLFLSANELNQVVNDLNLLISGYGSINQKRQKMQQMWLDLLKSQLGNFAEEEVMTMKVDKISELILGLPVQSNFIKNVKLQDITEPTIVSDLAFENYLDYFRDKVNVLLSILSEGYEQSFVSNGIRYYWIPVEDFP